MINDFFFNPLQSTANTQIHFGIRNCIESGGKYLFKTHEAVALYQKTLPNNKQDPFPKRLLNKPKATITEKPPFPGAFFRSQRALFTEIAAYSGG